MDIPDDFADWLGQTLGLGLTDVSDAIERLADTLTGAGIGLDQIPLDHPDTFARLFEMAKEIDPSLAADLTPATDQAATALTDRPSVRFSGDGCDCIVSAQHVHYPSVSTYVEGDA